MCLIADVNEHLFFRLSFYFFLSYKAEQPLVYNNVHTAVVVHRLSIANEINRCNNVCTSYSFMLKKVLACIKQVTECAPVLI